MFTHQSEKFIRTAGPSLPSVVLSPMKFPQEPHTELTRCFSISSNGREVGYISRGHSFIAPEERKKGVFRHALRSLEEFERGIFAAGRFREYRRDILNGIGTGTAGQAEAILIGLKSPHHIDFWRYAAVAAVLIKNDYTLDPYSVRTLQALKLIGEYPTRDELVAALENNAVRLRGHLICILTKPVAT